MKAAAYIRVSSREQSENGPSRRIARCAPNHARRRPQKWETKTVRKRAQSCVPSLALRERPSSANRCRKFKETCGNVAASAVHSGLRRRGSAPSRLLQSICVTADTALGFLVQGLQEEDYRLGVWDGEQWRFFQPAQE